MKTNPGSGLVIYAKDHRCLADFYAQVAALAVAETTEGYVVLESSGLQLVIVRMRQEIADQIVVWDPPLIREETPIKPVFIVPSLAASRAAAARTSGRVKPPEAEWRFGLALGVDGYDPEGNVFRLQQFLPQTPE